MFSRYFFVALFAMVLVEPASSQQNIGWDLLKDVQLVSKTDPKSGYEIESPVFGKEVLSMAGEEIELKGYIVPLEEMQGHKYFVLSALPYSICFFCGGAGPETVVEVYLKEEVRFTDDAIRIRGRLHLNPDDPLHLMYILKDAEIANKE